HPVIIGSVLSGSSALFDSYFRISNGNTQVSATELRALPLPAPEVLKRIAKWAVKGPESTTDERILDALGAN
ncbi:MAG: hypothetical protein ABI193_08330, partial [Minicystis sp.]